MIDFGLNPCPLCGGEAEVASLIQSPGLMRAVVKCTDCGLTLEWETEIVTKISRSGRSYTEPDGPDPIEAWNRRTSCEDCGASCKACPFKEELERINELHNCNDCAAGKTCEHLPAVGATARINCPLWREA